MPYRPEVSYLPCEVCGRPTSRNGLAQYAHQRGKKHQAALKVETELHWQRMRALAVERNRDA